jgi:hypothetical protein
MKTESAAFTAADVPGFFDEIFVHEMHVTARRLRDASARMRELATRVPENAPPASDAWNAKEVLAHMAVLSKAYGVFAYMVGTGRIEELQIGQVISQRDVVGAEMAAKPVADIVADATQSHEKTLAFLERATTEQLHRGVRTENGVITAEHLVRLPLVAHLEQHVEQLEQALA